MSNEQLATDAQPINAQNAMDAIEIVDNNAGGSRQFNADPAAQQQAPQLPPQQSQQQQQTVPEQQQQDAPAEIPPKPEGGHDKYYNPETGEYNWQNHAKEAEYNQERRAKQAAQNTPEQTTTPQDGDPNDPAQTPAPTTTPAADGDIFQRSGLDAETLVNEIATFGDVTESSRESLNAQGIPNELIDGYREGIVAKQELRNLQLTDAVGGQENLQSVMNWVKDNPNITDADRNRIAEGLGSDAWRYELGNLMSMMGVQQPMASGGTQPFQGLRGAEQQGRGLPDMNNQQNYAQIVRSEQFRNDPVYRQQVREQYARM